MNEISIVIAFIVCFLFLICSVRWFINRRKKELNLLDLYKKPKFKGEMRGINNEKAKN